jgi:hypothetical protein
MKLFCFFIKKSFENKPITSGTIFLFAFFAFIYSISISNTLLGGLSHNPSINLQDEIVVDYGTDIASFLNFKVKNLITLPEPHFDVTIVNEMISYDPKNLDPQQIVIRVKVYDPLKAFVLKAKDYNITVKVNPTPLSSPEIELHDNQFLTWDHQLDVGHYEVYLNGFWIENYREFDNHTPLIIYDLMDWFPGENHEISIKAIPDEEYRLNSDFSNSLSITWLVNPTISYVNENLNVINSTIHLKHFYQLENSSIVNLFDGVLLNLPEGYLTVFTQNISTDILTVKSLPSNQLELLKLAAPSLSVNSGDLVIGSQLANFRMYIYDNSFDYSAGIPEGVQRLTARNLAVENNQICSSFSNALVVNQLPTPRLFKQGNLMTTEKQTTKTQYFANDLLFDGTIYNLSPGIYTVKANNKGESTNELSSPYSNEIIVKKLITPSISFANKTLSISNGLGDYKLFFDGIERLQVSGSPQSWDFTQFPTGPRLFQIINQASLENEIDSNLSNLITIHRPNINLILSRPNNDQLLISWVNISNLEMSFVIKRLVGNKIIQEYTRNNKDFFGNINNDFSSLRINLIEPPLTLYNFSFDHIYLTSVEIDLTLSGNSFITNIINVNHLVTWS